MRSSPSTTKRRSLMRRLLLSASAVRTRSSSSSSAIRIVMERRAVGMSSMDMGDLVLGEEELVWRTGCLLGLAHRQAHREGGPVIDLAGGGDGAVMALDDLAAQGQPDPRPRVRPGSVEALEGTEDA